MYYFFPNCKQEIAPWPVGSGLHQWPVDSCITNRPIRSKLTAETDNPKTCISQNLLASEATGHSVGRM